MTEIAHLSARVPTETRNHFKALAARRGQAVQDLLLQLVEEFIQAETQTPPRRDTVVRQLQAHQAELVHSGIQHLELVGSFARNEARLDSDIDLILTFRHQEKPDLFQLSELSARIESWFDNRFSVDLALVGSLKPVVEANMAVDSVKVF